MEESDDGRIARDRGMEKLYENYPIDLLQRFMAATSNHQYGKEESEEEEIELNLGLSLGGRFGIDKSCSKTLIRSTSVASSIPLIIRKDSGGVGTMNSTLMEPVLFPTIVRASSLPTEVEEEWRKRKDLQALRRMQAKRMRLEKPAVAVAVVVKSEGCMEGKGREIAVSVNLRENEYPFDAASGGGGGKLGESIGLASWAASDLRQNSQGSVESQGRSSSGLSDFESKQLEGSGSAGEPISPSSTQALQEQNNHGTDSSVAQAEVSQQNPRTHNSSEKSGSQIGMSAAIGDMPFVFTKGDGPNGRRIDGILYKYGKGEVRIVCVCHGMFLSPAEFVKHAGGGDVAHPLRHIVINPSSNSFL